MPKLKPVISTPRCTGMPRALKPKDSPAIMTATSPIINTAINSNNLGLYFQLENTLRDRVSKITKALFNALVVMKCQILPKTIKTKTRIRVLYKIKIATAITITRITINKTL